MNKNPYRDENGHWTTKDNDNGPCNHSNVMAERNYERELAYNKATSFQDAKKVFDKVSKTAYGTFDFNGDEVTDRFMQKGFQVSIFRPEIEEVLSAEEINEFTNEIIDYLKYLEYPDIGCYGGPELSHYSNNKKKALRIAKIFNQESILDWSKTKDKDHGFFIDNPFYDANRKLSREDYYNGLKELKDE